MRLILTVAALAALPAHADDCGVVPADASDIAKVALYIEDNVSDGDLGVHGLIDDESWERLCVFDPSNQLILEIVAGGEIAALGLSGVFFESHEPGYDDWGYDALRRDFPEGDYRVVVLNTDGTAVSGAARFTTVLPLAPEILVPAMAPEPDRGPVPTVPLGDLTVEWAPVTASRDGRPMRITGYQVTVVKEQDDDPHSWARPAYSVHLGPEASSILVPAAFFEPGSVYELEVLTIEASGNQTIAGASFFAVE